jgi:hypothetical protein
MANGGGTVSTADMMKTATMTKTTMSDAAQL